MATTPRKATAHENDDIILGDYFQSGSNYTNSSIGRESLVERGKRLEFSLEFGDYE